MNQSLPVKYIKRGQDCRDACEGINSLRTGLMLELVNGLEEMIKVITEIDWLLHEDQIEILKKNRKLLKEVKE